MKIGKSVNKKGPELRKIERCEAIRTQNIFKMTEAEQIVKDIFEKHKIEYIAQYPIYTRLNFILIDFYLPKKDIAIEIDGSSHDGRRKCWQSYNKWRERVINKLCTKLVRFTNSEIISNSDNFREFMRELL